MAPTQPAPKAFVGLLTVLCSEQQNRIEKHRPAHLRTVRMTNLDLLPIQVLTVPMILLLGHPIQVLTVPMILLLDHPIQVLTVPMILLLDQPDLLIRDLVDQVMMVLDLLPNM